MKHLGEKSGEPLASRFTGAQRRGGDIESLRHILGHARATTTIDLYGSLSMENMQSTTLASRVNTSRTRSPNSNLMRNPYNSNRRSRLHRDPTGSPHFRLQPRHHRILLLLYHIRYATAELLAILYESGAGAGGKRVRNDLGDLYHAGYAERWYYPSRFSGFGSEQYVYTITPRGARFVLPAALYTRESRSIWHRSQRKAASTIPHRLAISELHLILSLGCTDSPRLVRFDRDQIRSLTFTVRLPLHDRDTTIRPDAGVVFEWPDGGKALYLVEIDISHRNRVRASRRFEAYHTYLTTHARDLKRAFHVDAAAALFIGDSCERADYLRRLARATFGRTPRRDRPHTLFWAIEHWHETAMVADRRYALERPRRMILPPAHILNSQTVRTLEGRERRLFPQPSPSQPTSSALH